MNKIITRAAAVLAATVLGAGGLALATASDASAASSRGTATVKEARKVVREADRQGCLTLAETRKIVHGTGTEFTVEGPTRGWQWAGRGNVRVLNVTFVHGCADFAMIDYRHGRTLSWANWTVGLGSPESF